MQITHDEICGLCISYGDNYTEHEDGTRSYNCPECEIKKIYDAFPEPPEEDSDVINKINNIGCTSFKDVEVSYDGH